jgi:hypothetical protein
LRALGLDHRLKEKGKDDKNIPLGMSGVWERVESVAAFPQLSNFVLSSLPLPPPCRSTVTAVIMLVRFCLRSYLFIVSLYKKSRKCKRRKRKR